MRRTVALGLAVVTSIRITGGTKYWAYTDAQGSFAGSFDTDIFTGGDMYLTGFPTNPFRKAQASGNLGWRILAEFSRRNRANRNRMTRPVTVHS